ncbi:MAG: transposase [Actinomycetota bacterium]|nr:transposase [Actinomycetota bacterium]
MAEVARELGIYDSTLGNWVKQDEIDRGVRDGVTTAEREEVTELRRENARLRIGDVTARRTPARIAKSGTCERALRGARCRCF